MELIFDINEDGFIPKDTSLLIKKWLMKNKGKKCRLSIKEHSPTNIGHFLYIEKVVYPILRDKINFVQGENLSTKDVDLMMRLKFWYSEEKNEKGKIIKKPRSKSEMTVEEMTIFVEKCKHFGNEYFGIESYPGESAYIIKS